MRTRTLRSLALLLAPLLLWPLLLLQPGGNGAGVVGSKPLIASSPTLWQIHPRSPFGAYLDDTLWKQRSSDSAQFGADICRALEGWQHLPPAETTGRQREVVCEIKVAGHITLPVVAYLVPAD